MGVSVWITGWKGVAVTRFTRVGMMKGAKGCGVAVGVGAAQERRRVESRKWKVRRDMWFVMREFFFMDRCCGSIG